MEGSSEPFQGSVAPGEEAPFRPLGSRWPLILIVLALIMVALYLPLIALAGYIFATDYSVYDTLAILIVYLAPLMYVLGVVFMQIEKMAGKYERAKFSTIGGVTLILGAAFSGASLLLNFNVWTSSGWAVWGPVVLLNFLVLPIVAVAGSLLGAYYILRRKSYTRALLAGSFSVLAGMPLFPLALVPIALGMIDAQGPEIRDGERTLDSPPGRKNKIMMVAVILIVGVLIASALLYALVLAPSPGGATELPVHSGDVITWMVNGTRDGQNVSGTSVWTFTYSNYQSSTIDGTGYSEYGITVQTTLNGVVHVHDTAGRYSDARLWSLGINPAGMAEGGGYYNEIAPTFDRLEALLTVYGVKDTAVYIERYNNNSTDMWSSIWIDVDSGMPHKMEMNEPAILNGAHNDLSGTLTFTILSTNMEL